jgi:hypothetical protein
VCVFGMIDFMINKLTPHCDVINENLLLLINIARDHLYNIITTQSKTSLRIVLASEQTMGRKNYEK